MIKSISPQEQALIAEKLYHTNDSITATRQFNKEHGAEVGLLGQQSLSLYDLNEMLKKAGFGYHEIGEALKVLE